MFKKLLNLFRYKEQEKSTPLKTLRDVDFFDTVWVKDKSGIIYEGWIYDKSKKHLIVTVVTEEGQYKDYRFIISKLNKSISEIEQNHNILYFNKLW